jgi:hypothetical protein
MFSFAGTSSGDSKRLRRRMTLSETKDVVNSMANDFESSFARRKEEIRQPAVSSFNFDIPVVQCIVDESRSSNCRGRKAKIDFACGGYLLTFSRRSNFPKMALCRYVFRSLN